MTVRVDSGTFDRICPAEGLRLAMACRNVVVPLDGSREAEVALGIGEWLTRSFGADLHLVTADVTADERRWYGPYLKTIAGESVPVVAHCSEDRDVVAAISRTAERLEASLVCLATHGRSRTAALVGSTFARLIAKSSDPVVAVGPRLAAPGGPDPRRTVVALDDAPSPLARHLVDQAAMWARALGHRLTFATVLHDGDRALAEATVRRLVAEPGLDDLEVDALVLGAGHTPHHALALHLAEHPATFLAAATHGRSGPALGILGSETARIIHDSPVPVLVVPPRARHRPG